MPPRRFHRKSRNGCARCRRRRVKCDMQAPVCANCHRRGETCEYQSLQVAVSPGRQARSCQPLASGALAAVVGGDPILTSGATSYDGESLELNIIRWLFDEKLMSTYTSTLQKTTWRRCLDREAQSHDYLRESIAALQALHAWYDGSMVSSELYAQAYRHHIDSSALFRSEVRAATDDNWMAAMGFAVGVIIFHLATSQASDEDFDCFQTFRVLRTTGDIIPEIGQFLRHSPLLTFFLSRVNLVPFLLDTETYQAIASLESLSFPFATSEKTRNACQSAIQALKSWVLDCSGYPRTWGDFVMWPRAVSADFLDLLEDRHPVALVTFAYWCAIMHRAPRRWFMERWAAMAFASTTCSLAAEWDNAIRWPKLQMRQEPKCYRLYNLVAGEQYSSLIRAGSPEEFD